MKAAGPARAPAPVAAADAAPEIEADRIARALSPGPTLPASRPEPVRDGTRLPPGLRNHCEPRFLCGQAPLIYAWLDTLDTAGLPPAATIDASCQAQVPTSLDTPPKSVDVG